MLEMSSSGNWVTSLCGSPVCSSQAVLSCVLKEMFDSSTCINHLVVIGVGVLLIGVVALRLLVEILKSGASLRQLVTLSSSLPLAAVVSNGCLGLVYLGLGLWMLLNISNQDADSVYWWRVTSSQGFTLIITSFAFSIRPRFLGSAFVRVWSVSLTIYAAFICCSSLLHILTQKKVITIKACLDVLSLPGAILFLLCGFQHCHDEEDGGIGNGLYKPLHTETADSESTTPFSKAGYFSEMSFWWLNPLMKMGYEKTLEDKDVPALDASDRAQNQYLMFMEKLNSKKQLHSHTAQSIFWTIASCHRRAIMVSGFFALLKVLTLSAGPLLLRAFINVSLGKGTFKYEGFVLAATMFVCKCCESLSQRQWYFRTRRLGRIGEFPYWFHQTWTTSVQLCIALAILHDAVGAAVVSSLGVVIITVLCNAPLAKFKKVIEGLREVEYRWLSAFQLRRAYNSFLFWSSLVLVSAATFLTCYLLKIPLDASNVFTTVATLRLVQDPVRSIPDVIAVVIQAKVAFTRISKFLDAPELNGQVGKKYCVGTDYPIVMKSCSFSFVPIFAVPQYLPFYFRLRSPILQCNISMIPSKFL